jgi:hypothetical protein
MFLIIPLSFRYFISATVPNILLKEDLRLSTEDFYNLTKLRRARRFFKGKILNKAFLISKLGNISSIIN